MKKQLFKLIGNILVVLCISIIVIAFLSMLWSMKDPDRILTIMGYKPGVVISGSMEPAIQAGDMIISKGVNPEDVKIGDVITYRVKGAIPVTHRVVGIYEKSGKVIYETKGDFNRAKDIEDISSDRLVGRMILKIPQAGYAVQFLKSKVGFTIVIIIPIIVLWMIVVISTFYKAYRKKIDG